MGVLSHLKPEAVFYYFEDICRIPHGSGNVAALVDYCVAFAEANGLEWERDEAQNLVIRKSASPGYENSDVLILQGHTDMVCEKETDLEFDFTKDAIRPFVDGDWLRAEGTTLGGDNGIAVAMCLALLADNSLPHPPLEVLLTSDEETGMLGAFAFDCNRLKGHKLINLDSEYEGVLMCSCAGGANAYSTLPVRKEKKIVQSISLEITGLASGHSGVEIHKGRANSNVLMARLLKALTDKYGVQLVELQGGQRETAIASRSRAVVGTADGAAEEVIACAQAIAQGFKKEYATTEPGMQILIGDAGVGEADVVTAEDMKKLCRVLLALPDAVQAMSADMPGLVQTSVNFGVLELREEEVYFSNTARSSMTSQKMWILEKVASIVELAGGTTEISGNYPGWSYNPNSVVKDTILAAYKKLFGKDATVDAVHAGIECGLFADSIPELDCVSIGPEMADVHTPREHLSISSVQRTYELLCEVLKESR